MLLDVGQPVCETCQEQPNPITIYTEEVMYFEYLKEREGVLSIQSESGFATYEIQGEYFVINDIYVKPESRATMEALAIAIKLEDLAKEAGCKYLAGYVSPHLPGATRSMKVQLDFGFKLKVVDGDRIILQKEL